MARTTWQDLPAAVRGAVEDEVGPVTRTESPSAGRNSDFSATLHTSSGPVFCKAIADSAGSRGSMHRREATVNPWLPATVAPRLRWQTEAAGWLLLGFDHVAGHHADLSPSSPDLTTVAATVHSLTAALTNCPVESPRLSEQWGRLSAWRRLANSTNAHLDDWAINHLEELRAWESRGIELADGDSLVHTDLHSYNILVGRDGARIVDWAWSRAAAPAVDVAFLVARLVAAGHSPASAERWADNVPVWRATTLLEKTAFAVTIWGIWTYKNIEEPRPLWDRLVPAAGDWARHCLGAVRCRGASRFD